MDKRTLQADFAVFRALLRAIRREAGLRQDDLARTLNKPQSFVSKYESGERRLDVLELRLVCHACGITLRNFVTRLEEEMTGVIPIDLP
jgi:transcriptional regulator with XRE-family HTH domain